MSVHGEYNRALEALVSWLREVPDTQGEPWSDAFTRARVSESADLSAAARACLQVLESFESEGPTNTSSDTLREATAHLRAHCRAILGISG